MIIKYLKIHILDLLKLPYNNLLGIRKFIYKIKQDNVLYVFFFFYIPSKNVFLNEIVHFFQ